MHKLAPWSLLGLAIMVLTATFLPVIVLHVVMR